MQSWIATSTKGYRQPCHEVRLFAFRAEPHILLFRRPLGTDPNTGIAPASILQKIQAYQAQLQEMNK